MADERLVARVLRAIDEELTFQLGSDARPIRADESLVDYFRETGWWEDLDLADFVYALCARTGGRVDVEHLQAFFEGTACDFDEWEREVAPRLTFRRFAEVLAERIDDTRIVPLEVAGDRCLPAGVFRSIQRIASDVRPGVERFAPSTRLHDRLCASHLNLLQRRLDWLTENRVPARGPGPFAGWIAWLTGVKLVCAFGTLLAAVVFARPSWLWEVALTVAGLFVSYRIYERTHSPFPDHVRTFGDLSRWVAERMQVAGDAQQTCPIPL